MGVPNLDCIPLADVQAFADKVDANVVAVANELFPSKPAGYVFAAGDLGAYAVHRVRAGKFRLAGDIRAALQGEAFMEYLYKGLPDYARW